MISDIYHIYKENILQNNQNGFLYKNNHYFAHYSTALQINEDNRLFGVGMKNFRKFCDNDKFNKKIHPSFTHRKCSTHPHNSLLELLVETGLIGLILFKIFIISVINFIYQKKNLFREKNFFKPYSIGLLITLFFFIWPIKSSGSMFTTFYMSFVWFNLGLLLCLLKKNDKY